LKRNRPKVLATLAVLAVVLAAIGARARGDDPPDEPLTVSAEGIRSCVGWYAPDPVEEIDANEIHDGLEWIDGAGGAPASPSTVMFTVQGTTDADVVLTGIDIEIAERRQPPVGALLHDGCGDSGAFRWLEVDLEATGKPKIVSYISGGADESLDLSDDPLDQARREPVQFPYHVAKSEAETFIIVAYAEECDCDWTASLRWQSQGDEGSTVIDNGGEPWRTVGLSQAWGSCGIADAYLTGGGLGLSRDLCTGVPDQEPFGSSGLDHVDQVSIPNL
jgi:hypothetical protein